MSEPIADRPSMPGGYLAGPPLPWQWAEERLKQARSYWVCTIAPDGHPHCRPVWGIWAHGTFQFSTGARLGVNIARDARVGVHLESGDDCVIVEGDAEIVDDEATRQAFIDRYDPKYRWTSTLDFVDVVYVVRPRVAFGWMVHDIAPGATLFGATATRWRFTQSVT